MTKKLTQGEQQPEDNPPIIPYDPDRPQPVGGSGGRRDTVIMIVLGAIIAFAIVWIMVPRLAPSKGNYERDITRLELDLVHVRENYVATEDVPDFDGLITTEDLAPYAKTADIPEYDDQISSLSARITTLESAPANGHSLDYSLSGTFGNYLLSVMTDEAGDYIARIVIVYDNPVAVGLASDTYSDALTAFYSSWLTVPNRTYECELVWDISDSFWKVKEVSFVTGKFTLTADVLTDLPILFTGPKSDAHNAYAEVLPLLTGSSSGGGGGI